MLWTSPRCFFSFFFEFPPPRAWAQNRTGRNGTGTGRNGTESEGEERDRTGQNGTGQTGTGQNGTGQNGAGAARTERGGRGQNRRESRF